jgi:tubulin polyglutamylase TTLL9
MGSCAKKRLSLKAIQKTAENYDKRTGGKLELQALKLYLMGQYGVDRIDTLFWDMQMIIIRALLAVQHVRCNFTHFVLGEMLCGRS